jgi:uncharacterized membrane protein
MAVSMPNRGSPGSILGFLETHRGQRLAVIAFSLVATLVLVVFPGSAAAYLFGFPYLFFIPGFVVVRLFFWKGTTPEAKFVLSIGLSILVVIFLGLGLVLTPIGLTSDTTRASLIAFTFAAVILDVLWKRPETQDEKAKATEEKQPRTVKLDKVVAAMLATALAVSVISVGLIITAKYPSRTYFAITDENGSVDFNTTREVNSTFTVILHMKNGERGTCVFRAVVHNETWNISQEFNRTLQKGETWNETVDVLLEYNGTVRIDFDLYITEGSSPEYHYGNLHLWLEVS